MKKIAILIFCGSSLLLSVSPVKAVTTTGNIGVSLILTNGCLINGSPTQSGVNFGTLNFGTHPATFGTLSTQLAGATSGNTFTIQCTTGANYAVQVTGTANAAPTTVVGTVGTPGRYLLNTTTPTQGVAYSIYSDSAFNNVIANNANVPIASTTAGVDSYTIFGRIQGGGNSVTVQPGTYTDTINVSVSY